MTEPIVVRVLWHRASRNVATAAKLSVTVKCYFGLKHVALMPLADIRIYGSFFHMRRGSRLSRQFAASQRRTALRVGWSVGFLSPSAHAISAFYFYGHLTRSRRIKSFAWSVRARPCQDGKERGPIPGVMQNSSDVSSLSYFISFIRQRIVVALQHTR